MGWEGDGWVRGDDGRRGLGGFSVGVVCAIGMTGG